VVSSSLGTIVGSRVTAEQLRARDHI